MSALARPPCGIVPPLIFRLTTNPKEHDMKALQDLFSTDYGIMSIVVIAAIVVGLGVAYVVLKAKMAESGAAAGK
jgi:hypothetical protein